MIHDTLMARHTLRTDHGLCVNTSFETGRCLDQQQLCLVALAGVVGFVTCSCTAQHSCFQCMLSGFVTTCLDLHRVVTATSHMCPIRHAALIAQADLGCIKTQLMRTLY